MENKVLLSPEEQQKLSLQDLQASGLIQETLNENQIENFDGKPEDLAELLNIDLEFAIHLCHNHAIIKFPYSSKGKKEVPFCRVKLIPAFKTKDGKSLKYLQPKGMPIRPYIIENRMQKAWI